MPSMAIMISHNPHHNYYEYRRSCMHNEKTWVTESLERAVKHLGCSAKKTKDILRSAYAILRMLLLRVPCMKRKV